MILFLEVFDVLKIHEQQIESFGGILGIRDLGLLESAVATPQVTFGSEYLHSNLFEMAAAYTFHIAENQPFLDGNKRTALTSALVFLDINGFIVLDEEMRLYQALIDIADKTMDKYYLAELLQQLAN